MMRMRITTVCIDCRSHFVCERAKSVALPHGPTLYTSKSRDLNVIKHVHNIKKGEHIYLSKTIYT